MAFKDSLSSMIAADAAANAQPHRGIKQAKYAEKQGNTRHLTFKQSDEFLERLDDWRAKRRPILTRSAAIKLMCEERMAADGVGK